MSQLKRTIEAVDSEGNVGKKEILVKEKKKHHFRELRFMSVGYYLAVPLVIAVFAGRWLDSYYQTKPVFTLVLITFGMLAAFYNLYKLFKDA